MINIKARAVLVIQDPIKVVLAPDSLDLVDLGLVKEDRLDLHLDKQDPAVSIQAKLAVVMAILSLVGDLVMAKAFRVRVATVDIKTTDIRYEYFA